MRTSSSASITWKPLHKQYREEAEKPQAERTAFRTQLEKEAQAVTMELELEVQQKRPGLDPYSLGQR